MRRVVRDAGRYVLDADLRFGEVVGHVAAAGSHVGGFGHPVEQDLLRRESRGDGGREIPVVREQIVPARPERHTQGELDRVVPGAGSVVAPPEALFEVVGCLVIQDAGQMHQPVPFLQFFSRRLDGRGGTLELRSFLRGQPILPVKSKTFILTDFTHISFLS